MDVRKFIMYQIGIQEGGCSKFMDCHGLPDLEKT